MTASYIPIGLPGNLKNRTGHRDAECVDGGRGMGRGISFYSGPGGLGERCRLTPPTGSGAEPRPKTKTIFVHFYAKKRL